MRIHQRMAGNSFSNQIGCRLLDILLNNKDIYSPAQANDFEVSMDFQENKVIGVKVSQIVELSVTNVTESNNRLR